MKDYKGPKGNKTVTEALPSLFLECQHQGRGDAARQTAGTSGICHLLTGCTGGGAQDTSLYLRSRINHPCANYSERVHKAGRAQRTACRHLARGAPCWTRSLPAEHGSRGPIRRRNWLSSAPRQRQPPHWLHGDQVYLDHRMFRTASHSRPRR